MQGSNPCLLHLLHWQVGSLPLRHPESPISAKGKVKPSKLLNYYSLAPLLSPSKDRLVAELVED